MACRQAHALAPDETPGQPNWRCRTWTHPQGFTQPPCYSPAAHSHHAAHLPPCCTPAGHGHPAAHGLELTWGLTRAERKLRAAHEPCQYAMLQVTWQRAGLPSQQQTTRQLSKQTRRLVWIKVVRTLKLELPEAPYLTSGSINNSYAYHGTGACCLLILKYAHTTCFPGPGPGAADRQVACHHDHACAGTLQSTPQPRHWS
jgi:hypothetical protein